uniref:Ig-like domain-containing protein n=1 Tax=Eptatretus burgeri TaxID=7764 RepID=A0A8C4QTJ6_EPTBU
MANMRLGLVCILTAYAVSGSKMQSNVFYVKEGEDVLLPCNLSENHQELSNIKWRFNNTIVLYHTAVTTTKTTKQRGKFVGNLRKGIGTMLLEEVRAYEEGNYTADLHAGEFSDTCKLFLIVKKADGMHPTQSTSLPSSSILSGNIVNATSTQLTDDSDFMQPWKIYVCGVGLLLLVLLVTTMVLFVYHMRKQSLKKIKEDRRKDKNEDKSRAMYINTASRKYEDHCIYYN